MSVAQGIDSVAVATQLATLASSMGNLEKVVGQIRDDLMQRQGEHETRIGANTAQVQELRLDVVRLCSTADSLAQSLRTHTQHETEVDRTAAAGQALVLEDYDGRIKAMEKLAPAMRVVIWLGGALGLSVLTLVWAMITGQAVVMFAP